MRAIAGVTSVKPRPFVGASRLAWCERMPITSAENARGSAAVGARHPDAHAPAWRQLGRGLAHAGRTARFGRGRLTELHALVRHLGADVSPVARTRLPLVPPPGRNARGRAIDADHHAGLALGAAAGRTLGTGIGLGETAIDRRHRSEERRVGKGCRARWWQST